jgi:DNA polymerase I-like protein with 3'-5' exonuclease and polymerase domains
MNVLTFDVETTHRPKANGGFTPLPYFGNHLVSIGYLMVHIDRDKEDGYLCFYHNDQPATRGGFEEFQGMLDRADIIVGHNIKFDLNWVLSCNFKYGGPVYDTMVAEYLLARARKWPLSLEALAKRYEVTEKKKDLTEDYLKEGKTFAEIPWEIVEEYGRADVQATWEVADKQVREKYQTTWTGILDGFN